MVDQKASFDILRYANCWEDAEVLIKGLQPEPGGRILSIGSAGDNSFSLLTSDPEIIYVVDISRPQLYLIELKKIAFQYLTYDQLLDFLGFNRRGDRVVIFNSLKQYLPSDALTYWESNLESISKGVIMQGKFEKYFHLFSHKILPWIHDQKKVEALLEKKSSKEQFEFYHKYWNTWRWKILFRIFFGRYVMGKYGRDPEFLKQVEVPVNKFIFTKAERHLQSEVAQANQMLRFQLTGNFGKMLPHYLLPENHEKIKSNLHKLVIVEGYAEDIALESGPFDSMNLSNIFEYMDMNHFRTVSEKLISTLKPGARIAYWNLMVPRQISSHLNVDMEYLEELSDRLSSTDKGFFYSKFVVEKRYIY